MGIMKFISVENVPTQPKIILTDKDEKKQIASIMKLLKKKGIEFFKYFMVPRKIWAHHSTLNFSPKLFLFI